LAQQVPEQVESIAILDLRVAPWNARKTIEPSSLAELVASVEAHRIQVPLLVRAYRKQFYVTSSQGSPEDKVWYLACKNIVGRENLLETFSHRSPEDNRKAAEAAATKRNGDGNYEIVCGHRRFAAAKQIGINYVPCIVRELTDDQAREIGLVDNLQREDVPAMEEADAYNELKQRLGTPAAIAARVGKDVSYVTRRLQLVSLAEMPRRALQERLITIDHALLFARLGADEQNVNLKWCLRPGAGTKEKLEDVLASGIKDRDGSGRYGYYEAQSVLELKSHIEENVGRKLSRAPWDLDDAGLFGAAGACSSCPSNTKANDLLFGDMSIAAATCENGACFEQKRDAFVLIRQSKASDDLPADRGPALRLSWKSTTVKPRVSKSEVLDVDGFTIVQTFKQGQWLEAKKGSCEFIRTGVTVDWSDGGDRGYMHSGEKLRKPGQILTICIAEACKAHKKSYTGAARKASSNSGYDPKVEEEKREKQKQAAIVESKIRMAAATAAVEKVKAMPADALRAIVLNHLPDWSEQLRLYEALMPGIKKIIQTAKLDSVEFARAVAVASIDHPSCREHNDAKSYRSEFLASLKRIGHDASKAWLALGKARVEKAAPPPRGASSSSAPTSSASTKPAAKPAKKKTVLPAAARKRIAEAQRKRWAVQAAKKKAGRK
jgi:ParB/RepB/Spo0J family partition protein